MTKEQLAQIQRELADKQAEADRQRLSLATLEKQQADARRQIEVLTIATILAEQEKKNLRETADALKGQVEVERTAGKIRIRARVHRIVALNRRGRAVRRRGSLRGFDFDTRVRRFRASRTLT